MLFSISTFVYNTRVRIIRYSAHIVHSAIQTLEHALISKQQIQMTDLERVLISTRVDEIHAKFTTDQSRFAGVEL